MWIIIIVIAIIFLILGLFMAVYFLIEKIKYIKKLQSKLENYIPIEQINEQLTILGSQLNDKNLILENTLKEITRQYNIISDLNNNISSLKIDENLIECGFYEKHYDFDKLVGYERKLKENLTFQKKMLITQTAIISSDDFPFDGSKAKAKTFTKKLNNIILHAFNAECDEAILKINYKNIVQYETKLEKLFETLNKRFSIYGIELEESYRDLKIEQLQIVNEYQEKKEEEKEEQRRIKEIMSEQLRDEREIEKVREGAERDEKRCLEALAQARAKVDTLSEEKQRLMLLKIEELTIKLHDAQEKREKAISMAQLTKAGYIYVISNIGSFGENVFKIGMTRRLEPMDRVKELGDASVPFSFDVHAMIFSENAPELENNLHKILKKYQLNKVNSRKEFFKVDISFIENAVSEYRGDFKLTKLAEAKEFHQTEAINKHNHTG